MKRIALAALALMFLLTGCSSDEDAFLEAVHATASPYEVENFTDADFITTGGIACGMMKEGKEPDLSEESAVTGVTWVSVWIPASEHLC